MKEAYVEHVSKDLAQGLKGEFANFAHIPLIPFKRNSNDQNRLISSSAGAYILVCCVFFFYSGKKIKYKIC